jgi:hypothetical protein
VECPDGVDAIDVRRVGVTFQAVESSTISQFEVVVGYDDAGAESDDLFNPMGILAVLTDGAPIADVMQTFLLDTADNSKTLYFRIKGSNPYPSDSYNYRATIIFSGPPVP